MKNATKRAEAGPKRARGRPRAFDREAALEAAMQVFWEKGYEATSISDLTGAMGINPPSLYAAFGDKESLFLEAIERYQESHRASCPFDAEPTARAALETLLRYLAELAACPDHPRGCLMTMAAMTSANASPRLQRVLARKRSESRERIRQRIEQGMVEGDVPAGTDAAALADFYAAIMAGMPQLARDGASPASLLATVERALSLFPAVVKKPARAPRRAAAAA